MTKRERLLKVFNNEKVDRVPVAPFIHDNFVKEFYKDNNIDIIEKTVGVYDYFGFDIIHRTCTIWKAFSQLNGTNWKVDEFVEEKDKGKIVTTVITTPERQLKQVVKVADVYDYESVQAKTEYFIKEENDFKQFLKYQPQVPEYDCSPIKRAKELVGEKGVLAPWVNGAFNSVSEMRKLDNLIIDAYTKPEFYHEMISYFSNRSLQVMKQFKNAGADVLSYTGNIGNGSLVGPKFFKENILTYEKRLIEEIQDYGAHVLYHNCGDAASLLDVYSDVGFSAYESLTPPPYGDTNLDEALSKLDKDITLLGNIDQIDLLRKGTKEEIELTVKNLLDKVKMRGNFILSTSDYLNENTPVEKVRVLADAGFKYGVY